MVAHVLHTYNDRTHLLSLYGQHRSYPITPYQPHFPTGLYSELDLRPGIPVSDRRVRRLEPDVEQRGPHESELRGTPTLTGRRITI